MFRSDGCRRPRWKVTSWSLSTVISSRLSYQGLRGFLRIGSDDWPMTMSQVHFTSFAVNGWPSCHLTPSRSVKLSSVPSSFQRHSVAKSGMMDRSDEHTSELQSLMRSSYAVFCLKKTQTRQNT